MKKLRKRRLAAIIIGILFLGTVLASFYFFHVAQVRGEKSFVGSGGIAKTSPLYAYEKAFDKKPKSEVAVDIIDELERII